MDNIPGGGGYPAGRNASGCSGSGGGYCFNASGGSGGTSKGALAGAVVGALVALAAAIGLFVWYWRRRRLRAAEAQVDVPAPAKAVLNRPDPSEKLSSHPLPKLPNAGVDSTHSDGSVDPDTESQISSSGRVHHRLSTQLNPFSDAYSSSIQTIDSTGTDSFNVIPILFVPPSSMSTLASTSTRGASENHPLTTPARPARTPEVDLGTGWVNISQNALSQISGISGASSSRHSNLSNISFASELLNEAAVIVTPTQGGVVRQVIGSVRAEMVNTSGPSTPTSLASRFSVRSILNAHSFGPSDVLREHEEEPEGSPFDDENASGNPTPRFFRPTSPAQHVQAIQ